MGLKVPLDDHMPVTADGTMYWFRTDTLKKMFEWRWRDYNPEPNHVDGGLAHVQERQLETMAVQGGCGSTGVCRTAMVRCCAGSPDRAGSCGHWPATCNP